MLIEKELKISVMSFLAMINIDFSITDLITLARYLPINKVLLGLELNYLRGAKIIKRGETDSKTEKGFYNQLTLLINIGNKNNRKVKIFTHGKIHVCGCNSENDPQLIYNILNSLLFNFKVNKKIEMFPLGNLIVDNEDFIYNCHNNIIGVLKETDVYIHFEKVVPFLGIIENIDYELFISSKYHLDYKKTIYDTNGNIIGELNKSDKKITYFNIPEKNIDFKERIIYKLNTNSMKLSDVQFILINSFYKYKNDINKDKLKDKLLEKGYHIYYEPLIYHALKVMYYFGENSKNGICSCISKCNCKKSTCLVSSNGSVLLYGFKSIDERDEVYNWLNITVSSIV